MTTLVYILAFLVGWGSALIGCIIYNKRKGAK